MANWEFAAIVCEEEMWFLVKPAEVEPLRFTVSAGFQSQEMGPVFKWHQPMNWIKGLEEQNRNADYHNKEYRQNTAEEYWDDRNLVEVKSNDLSEPNILYKSEDILTLVNMAGGDGWEITGGIGLSNFEWRDRDHGGPISETKWRMMRREL